MNAGKNKKFENIDIFPTSIDELLSRAASSIVGVTGGIKPGKFLSPWLVCGQRGDHSQALRMRKS